jgi:hypothetical protein
VHNFRGTDNGVYRAGLNTQCAANADTFVNNRNSLRFGHSVLGVQGECFYPQEIGQRLDTSFTTRRALIDPGLARSDRFGIRATAGKIALTTLGLREYCIDPLDH